MTMHASRPFRWTLTRRGLVGVILAASGATVRRSLWPVRAASAQVRDSTIVPIPPSLTTIPARAQDEMPAPEPGFVSLFDGTEASFANWQVAGRDGFALVDGAIETRPGGDDLGLLYYAPRPFTDFILRLQVRVADPADNSGVHLRFRDPRLPMPAEVLTAPGAALDFPNRSAYADNGSWLAVDTGFEVQIDDLAGGIPDDPSDDGLDQKRTGAIYDVPLGDDPGHQVYQRGPELVPGEWYDLEIEVRGETYTARLNGQQTTAFTNVDPLRGISAADDATSGYIGVQAIWFNRGHVDFRDIRIKELPAGEESAAMPVNGATGSSTLHWERTGDITRSSPTVIT
jgi:hypothetical protein